MRENGELSLFPSAPDGANMFSRYVVHHVLSASPSENASKKLLFGVPGARVIDPFGASIGKLLERHPRIGMSASALLEQATLFKLYGAALEPERKEVWRASLLAGQGRLINKFVTGQAGFRLVKQFLHFCEDCVKEDEEQYGIGFWRLVHQVPGVRICPSHFACLQGACKSCGRAIASENDWHPPSRICPYCAGSSFHRLAGLDNQAFERFIAFTNSEVIGVASHLAPSQRTRIYAQHCGLAKFGEVLESDLNSFIAEILEQWRKPTLKALQEFLEVPMTREFIKQALCGQDHILNPIGHLALMASFQLELRLVQDNVNVELSLSQQCRDVLREHLVDEESVIEELRLAAIEHGLPAMAGILLLQATTQRDTFRRLGVCGSRLSKFRKVIDTMSFACMNQRGERGSIRFGDLVNEIRQTEIFVFPRRVGHSSSVSDDRVLTPVTYKGRSEDSMRKVCRQAILQAMEVGVTLRRDLPFTASKWCRANDRKWLDLVLPLQKRRPIDLTDEQIRKLPVSQLRKQCRTIILEAIRAGVGKCPSLPKRASAWAKQYDKAWFTRLPARKRSKIA